ncbi:hypothetical protein [Phormidesmis sp. 146-33]
MTEQIELTIDFQDSTKAEKQEKLTQTLWEQMKKMPGVKVDRVSDPNPPDGSRAIGAFLWGLLQAEVSVESVKTLFGFLGDRLGDKPIKGKAKFPDGREFEFEASSRAELLAAEETIQRLAQIK